MKGIVPIFKKNILTFLGLADTFSITDGQIKMHRSCLHHGSDRRDCKFKLVRTYLEILWTEM